MKDRIKGRAPGVLSLLALPMMLAGTADSARAAEVSVGYDGGLYSAYVWRGIVLTDGPVFQPSVTASVGGFSFNTWGNFELDDVNDNSGRFTELDATLSYSLPLEGVVSVDVGLINYNFPNTFLESTNEIYLSLGFDVPVSPFVNVYYDFDGADDYYANFGIGYGTSFGDDKWSWALSLSAGLAGEDWASFAAGGTDAGFFDGNIGLGVDYDSGGPFHFGLSVTYTDTLDDKVLPDQPTNFWGGLSIGWSF